MVRVVAQLAGLVLILQAWGSVHALAYPQQQGKRPNIVLILTDDMDAEMGSDQHLPKLKKYIADEGLNFTSFTANYAVCCPARTTILTGQCSHNTGVVGAGYAPLGGFHAFLNQGLETKTAPYFLQQQGFRTGLIGKYLNMYTNDYAYHIPPGWERWLAFTSPNNAPDFGTPDYYNYSMSDQGFLTSYGDSVSDYSTDLLARKAVEFIHVAKDDDRPFFLYLTPYACHRPHVPAPRHLGKFADLKVPRVPSYNESQENIDKKASFFRTLPPISEDVARALDLEYRTRIETLQAVDDLIEDVIKALEDVGQLDNTYVFFSADNGFKLGHHRLPGKMSPYESDVRLPFYVRGPGVPKGLTLSHLVGNVDFAPTWLELAGVDDPLAGVRDGISIAPILRGDPEVLDDPERHRVAFLIEKPVTTGGFDKFTSILTPVRDPLDDPFANYRPRLLPNGTWPKEVLAWEFQGEYFNEFLDQIVAAGPTGPWYLGLEKTAGFRLYLNLTKEQGIPFEAVARGLNENNPTAYFALRYQDRHRKLKYIEFPGGYELYDLLQDKYEVNNIFNSAPRELIAALQNTLSLLKVCRGSNCHVKNTQLLAHVEAAPITTGSQGLLQL